MIKILIIILLMPFISYSQTYELKGVSVDGSFIDSFYIRLGTDSLFGKVGNNYTFRSRQGTIQYTSEGNITGNTIPAIASTQSALFDSLEAHRAAIASIQTSGGVAYSSLTGIPATFPPSAHAHDYNSLTGLPTLFDGNYNSLTNKPVLFDGTWLSLSGKPATFTPSAHVHPQSEITNLVTDLAGKQPIGSYLVAADIAGKLNTNGSAAALTNFPTFNQNTSGTAAGLSAVLSFANGGISASAATSATTGTMTVNMTSSVVTITPTGACTFNASGGVAGQIVTFSITTSGTSSFVLTFGTNFRKVGTLATGTTSARFFSVTFICINGTVWQEVSRTAVQT